MPVVAVLHGAVVGGGLELAAAAHVRVAERSAFYALPEASRGIYVGGGGSVRLPPLIGTARVMDMMLTGRTLSRRGRPGIGLTQYLVDDGHGLAKGIELAHRIAGNAPFTNFAVMHLLPRIARSDPAAGFVDRGAGRRDRAGRRGGQGAAQGVSGKARAQSGAQLTCRARRQKPWRKLSQEETRAAAAGQAWRGRMSSIERRGDGAILMRSPHPLPPHPEKLTERLVHWANAAPDRVFLAQRDAEWRLAHADLRARRSRRCARSRRRCCERDLSPERPIAILSGNDIEHALLGLAAMHVGIPYAPISVPYSLLSQDFGKLKAIIGILTPGLVFAANGTAFARAIAAAVPPGVEIVVAGESADRPANRVRSSCRRPAGLGRRSGACARHARTRSRKSCSPPVRPASPKASSTPSACCARTRR